MPQAAEKNPDKPVGAKPATKSERSQRRVVWEDPLDLEAT